MMFLDCPAYLDQDRAVRCGLPAEVRCRFTMRSTDGPLESVMIRCPAGHSFSGPIEFLTPDSTGNHVPGTTGPGSRAGRDSLQRGHDDPHGDGASALRHFPAGPQRKGSRPNTAPAYYLGHPAALWITAMRPRRRPASTRYPMEATVSGGNPTRDSGVLQHSWLPVIGTGHGGCVPSPDSPIRQRPRQTQHPSQRTRADGAGAGNAALTVPAEKGRRLQ
jgi:hypothetical protein